MPVKGLVTFSKDGLNKTTYSHRNSFPAALGARVVDLCRSLSTNELSTLFDELEMVDEDSNMTMEQIEACKKYLPDECWKPDLDWLTVLKYSNDIIKPIKDGFGFAVEYGSFLGSMRCRWVYVINLDTNTLGIYKNGLEKLGIMSDVDPAQYFTEDCVIPLLVGEFPLNNIPENWLDIVTS